MATKIFTFPESTSQTQTHTVTISDLVSVSSVTVNTGNVTLQSVNGKDVTIQCSNGAYSRRVQTGGSYTPPDTKTVTQAYTVTGTREYRWSANEQKWYHKNTTWNIPSSKSYNSGGYSGTLYPTGSVYNYPSVSSTVPSSLGSTDGQIFTVSITGTQDYSGSVTRPESDTRTYQYYYQYTVTINYVNNTLPTLTLNTTDNRTLYENDTLIIDGSATDTDSGNVISVKYKIDNGTYKTIDAKVSDGSTPLTFSKSLTFKQGKLYDGETAITGNLETGVAHTLTVWSEDDQGGKSADVVRTFYVVPNRAPQITVDPFTEQSNLINADIITISGTASDPENDNVVVSYQLNGGAPVEVYNGAPGNWSFDLQLKSLQKGDNTVVLEVTDIYGVKTSKTLKITKTPNTIPLKNAVAMWKITPPAGSAQEVLAWIQREIGDLAVSAEVSMTNAGEQENFVPMTLTNTAPVDGTIAEDEFNYLAASAKDTIILKLNLSRTDTSSNEGIKLVSGVLE